MPGRTGLWGLQDSRDLQPIPRVKVLSSGLKLLWKKLMVHKGDFLRKNANHRHLGSVVPRAPLTSWGVAFSRAGFDWQMLELTYQCQDAVCMFLQGPRLIIRILPKQMAC